MEDVHIEDSEGYKRCPDCAELVRAQARKCRFCGYRFDAPEQNGVHAPQSEPQQDGSPSQSEPHQGKSRKGKPDSVTELAREWGVEFAYGEEVTLFAHSRAKAASRRGAEGEAQDDALDAEGFLLVTDRRLMFFVARKTSLLGLLRRERTSMELAYSSSLAVLGAPTIEGGKRRAKLLLDGGLELSGIASTELERLRELIEAR